MMNNVRPQLKMLSEDQIQQVHQYVLRILSETGVRVVSPSVIEMLGKTGQVEVQGRTVKISPELIEQSIQSAPPVIQMYDRRGNPSFRLGDDRLRFGVGVTALYYQEPVGDNLELFQRRHMRAMTRLGSSLPHYDVISTPGIVRDVPEELGDLYGNLEMFANTSKTMVVLTSDENKFLPLINMFEHLHGELGEKPFVLPYFNPISPLVMDSGTLLKMEMAIERGLPFIFSNFSMAGASTPLTPAGTLAILLAELLAGLTISQVMKPGTPIAVGMLPSYFDMQTMLNFYDPQSVLLNVACAEMMAHYKLPHCGASCSGMGWGMDLIAADTYGMNFLTYALTKGGLAPFIGDGLAGKSISPCTVVHAHEIIDQAFRFANGFQLDDAQAALDEIAKVGPGGDFLSSPSTRRNYKTGYYKSPLYPRWNMEKWQAEGQPEARDLLREKTQALLQDLPAPDDYDVLIGKGEEYINSL
ncbi:MAG: trimethylamine methyltransferase family protein [Anaerolineales bacterium]|uniref:Trimethylamine methyltransferase family protein n=1 Tax=Candidatus Desulfolinea nitratireducens TaxID=2841698 RepID=A0A8J6NL65_9CHLR|nr:trimethylamine methyltransferase family protein [Candidatus Desulfolinea nitratireducens]MBL6960076.1 trimethylamine methyltransferase family protein [Anaerolineales bacterium]